MRSQLKPSRGMTLIELMVGLVITAILISVAAPYFGDYVINARMREGGNAVMAEALYAQSEALKRNNTVQLNVTTTATQVIDTSVTPNVTLRTRSLPEGLTATATAISFGSDGMTRDRGTQANIDLGQANVTCSDEFRCPRIKIEAGGSIRLCGNKLSCS